MMNIITTMNPGVSFCDISGDRNRRSLYLTCQSILFLCRESSGYFINRNYHVHGLLPNL